MGTSGAVDESLGYPAGRQHGAHGWFRHLTGVATTTSGPSLMRVALERSAGQRVERLKAAARPRRRTASGTTMRALVARPGGRLRWCDVPAPRTPGPEAALVHPIAEIGRTSCRERV